MQLNRKGINGILYLTNAPKLVLAIPTPKAKNIENMKANAKKGSVNISLKNLKGESLNKRTAVKNSNKIFSTTEITIIGLPISQGRGLKIDVKMAIGANRKRPVKDPSISPIL